MFSIFLRRIQRFLLPIKIILLLGFSTILIYMFVNISPGTESITFAALIIFMVLAIVFNFFFGTQKSLLVSLAVTFLLFLRAVSLFNLTNLVLFALFLLLLGLYLRKR